MTDYFGENRTCLRHGELACPSCLTYALNAAERERDEAHVHLSNVSGALCDASNVAISGPESYAAGIRALTAERDEAKADNAQLEGALEASRSVIESLVASENALRRERDELREALAKIRTAVDVQAEDDGLWHQAVYASEAYIQQELRRLHDVVERALLTPREPG